MSQRNKEQLKIKVIDAEISEEEENRALFSLFDFLLEGSEKTNHDELIKVEKPKENTPSLPAL